MNSTQIALKMTYSGNVFRGQIESNFLETFLQKLRFKSSKIVNVLHFELFWVFLWQLSTTKLLLSHQKGLLDNELFPC